MAKLEKGVSPPPPVNLLGITPPELCTIRKALHVLRKVKDEEVLGRGLPNALRGQGGSLTDMDNVRNLLAVISGD